jgi:threonine/homoserine/homoserine lactone efflux protein
METSWWAFLGVVLLAYAIPGPDFAVILRASTRHWRHGAAAAAGAQAGLLVHLTLAVAGLSVVLARHAEALTVIRVVGGLYLVYLGGRLVASTLGHHADPGAAPRQTTSFRDGFLTNVTNPKAILFFAAVLPQFVGDGSFPIAAQVAVLGVVDVVVGFLPWAVVVLLGSRLGIVLSRAHVRDWWDRVTGAALAGLGGTLLVKGP